MAIPRGRVGGGGIGRATGPCHRCSGHRGPCQQRRCGRSCGARAGRRVATRGRDLPPVPVSGRERHPRPRAVSQVHAPGPHPITRRRGPNVAGLQQWGDQPSVHRSRPVHGGPEERRDDLGVSFRPARSGYHRPAHGRRRPHRADVARTAGRGVRPTTGGAVPTPRKGSI